MRRLAPAAVLLTLLTGCAGIQSPLNPASDEASGLFSLWNLMLVVCGFMYLLVLGFLGWALWRARRKLAAADAPQSHVDDRALDDRVVYGRALFRLHPRA